jgi:hypothetical protein
VQHSPSCFEALRWCLPLACFRNWSPRKSSRTFTRPSATRFCTTPFLSSGTVFPERSRLITTASPVVTVSCTSSQTSPSRPPSRRSTRCCRGPFPSLPVQSFRWLLGSFLGRREIANHLVMICPRGAAFLCMCLCGAMRGGCGAFGGTRIDQGIFKYFLKTKHKTHKGLHQKHFEPSLRVVVYKWKHQQMGTSNHLVMICPRGAAFLCMCLWGVMQGGCGAF